jgi:FMN phosphatase YigB (HAD superfamily)
MSVDLEQAMITTLLFDLDDTLLHNPMDVFIPAYVKLLAQRFAVHVPPEKFVAELYAATQAMVTHTDPTQTNAPVFADNFFPAVGLSREELMPQFDEFYAREYRDLRVYVQPRSQAREIVARAFEMKFNVAVATSPLFPRVAIEERLHWAGVRDFPYALITAYEVMHATKPHTAYYLEIARLLNCAPGDCLMIGNDVQADILPARRVGMKTFWITDAGAWPTDVPADWRGTLGDFGDLLRSGELRRV